MRRILVALLLAAVTCALVAGTGLGAPRPWVPDMMSPPDPVSIQSDQGTPAQDNVPSKPWLGGYPYDKVPSHPLPEDRAGGPR